MRHHPRNTPVPPDARGAAIALGNFDGVHIGHQAVLASARAAGQALGAPLGAAVFEPHPRRFFQPEAQPFRLQTGAQRAHALDAFGADHLYEIGFDAALAQMSDRTFAIEILHRRIGAVHVSVGANFRFGRGRMGDVDKLAELGEELGFSVATLDPVAEAGAPVSSSAIRAAVANGDMGRAAHLLTRPWAIEGEVVTGFQRGRDFGFPTANVSLGRYLRPRYGIYAVRAHIGAPAPVLGVASIGVNPTVGALPEPVLEAHLFDFSGDLYGRRIEVELIVFLRDEARFDTIEALKAQMALDADAARKALTGG